MKNFKKGIVSGTLLCAVALGALTQGAAVAHAASTNYDTGSVTYNEVTNDGVGTISVQKFDTKGVRPIVGSRVEIVDPAGTIVAKLVTNKRGEASVTLRSGYYYVKDASASDAGNVRNSVVEVVVTDGGTQKVTFYNNNNK